MAANAFTLFGTISVDTSKFQAALDKAEGKLKTTKTSLDAVEKSAVSLGQTSATTSRNFEKLNSALQAQQQRLKGIVDAYTAGKMTAAQFASALGSVASATDRVSNSAKDAAARMTDLKNATDAAAKKTREKADADTKAKTAAQAAAAAEKAIQQAVKDSAKAVQTAKSQTTDAINKSRQAAENASRVIKKALADQERAERAAAKASQDATKQISDAYQKRTQAIKQFGSSLGGVADAGQSLGRDLSALVTVPIAAVGGAALASAMQFDNLRNQLYAAAGGIDAGKQKWAELLDITRSSPGVFMNAAVSMYAILKPSKIGEENINNLIKAFGRLQLASDAFDPNQFVLNMSQLWTQGFEMQDVKQAFTFFPRFGDIMKKAFNLSGVSREVVAKEMRNLQEQGKLTYDSFVKGIADAVNADPVLKALGETIGNRFKKAVMDIQLALEPLGKIVAAQLGVGLMMAVNAVRYLADAFDQLSPTAQNVVVAVGGLVAAIGPISLIFFTVVGAIAGFITVVGMAAAAVGLTLGPALAVLAVALAAIVVAFTTVAATIAGFYLAWQDNFKNIQVITASTVQAISDSWNILMTTLSTITQQILTALGADWQKTSFDIIDFIKGVAVATAAAMNGIAIGIKYAAMVFGTLATVVSTVVAMIISTLRDVLNVFVWLGRAVKALVNGDWEGAMTAMTNAVDRMFSAISKTFNFIPSMILGVLFKLFPNLEEWGNRLLKWFEDLGLEIPAAIARGIIKNSSLVGIAIDNLPWKGGGGAGTEPTTATGTTARRWFYNRDRSKDLDKILKKPILPTVPKMDGGGGGRGATGTDPYTEALKRLRDAIRGVGIETEVARVQSDLLAGVYGKLTDAEITQLNTTSRLSNARLQLLLTLADEFDKKQANIRATKLFAQSERQLADEKRRLLAVTNAQIAAAIVLSAQYDDLTPAQRAKIRADIEENLNIADRLELYKDLDKQLEDIINVNTKNLTLEEKLKKVIEAAAKAGKVFTQAQLDAASAAILLNAAMKAEDDLFENIKEILKSVNVEFEKSPRAWFAELTNGSDVSRKALDRLIKATGMEEKELLKLIEKGILLGELKKPMEDLTALMDTLGLSTKEVVDWNAKWQELLANPEALAAMATRVGKSVEQLTATIQMRLNELNDPTFFGQLSIQLDELRKKAIAWPTAWATSFTTALTGIGDVFANALSNWDGTAKGFFKSLADGFRQLIGEIISQLIKLAAMRLVMMLVGAMVGGGNIGSLKEAQAATNAAGFGPFGINMNPFAAGGLVSGGGTGTSDSIPALLSNGEYVIPANVVKVLGLNFLEGLRNMQVSGMAGMPSVSNVSDNRSSSVNNSNVFNINVAGGVGGNQTATMVQQEILKGLRKVDKRNR